MGARSAHWRGCPVAASVHAGNVADASTFMAEMQRERFGVAQLVSYVQWHLCQAWRELTFADAEQQVKATRDPVAPAWHLLESKQGPKPL